MPKEPDHKDILGNYIRKGDSVVVPVGTRRLKVGLVKSLAPKMIVVTLVDNLSTVDREKKVYPQDCLVVNDPKVTKYLLQNQSAA